MKKAIIFTVIVFLVLSLLSFAGEVEKRLKKKGLHVAELTDTDKINLQVNKLQQAIQQQWIEEIAAMLSGSYAETDPTISQGSVRDELGGLFSSLSQTRGFSNQTNPQTGWKVTATQDFYVQNVKINVQEDKAVAECEMGFYSAGKDYKNIKESLSFVLKDHAWLLAGSKNLFGFLKQASKTTEEGMGTPTVRGEVMRGTKDDFISTHMLVPVNLFVYDGTPVPRFNKTESLRWFWKYYPPNWYPVNVMNYPYGILADVLVTPRGEDELNHDFLFVSDVTADKIIATQMNDWIAEFGTEGSGQDQFWEPHGISSLLSSYYFVAEKLNNRVSVYEFQNGWSKPQWQFALEAGFHHPRDVEVKERTQTDPQDDTRIVVADMQNHRLAFFRWFPCPIRFDRFYGEYGSGEGQFIWPTSVCFGRDPQFGWQTDDVFVTDKGNHRLVRLYIEPDNIIWRGSYQFPADAELSSVEVDNKGLVYVVDRRNGKVYKFAVSECYPFYFSLLGVWGETGPEDGQLCYPDMLTVAHGRECPHPNPCYPLTNLGDVFVTEAWRDETGVRRFVIASDVLNLTADWVPYNEDTGEGNFIWWEYCLSDFATVTEEVLLGAEVCTTYSRGSLNWGGQGGAWPVDGHPHGAYYTVKVTATSIYDPTIVVDKTVDVYVDTFTIQNPVITQDIRCNHFYPLPFWCDDCYQCVKEGHFYTLDVQAFDPDGYSLTYEWSCAEGDFWDGTAVYKEITTSENYICYIAPPPPSGGKPSKEVPYEAVMVIVRNEIGAEASDLVIMDNYLYGYGTTCLCGDVDDNLMIDLGDILGLQSYLYHNGPPPVDPFERGDVNNDCLIDMGDVWYLINYLYKNGPYPECCWIHGSSPATGR